MNLSQAITQIKSEVPVDWSKRVVFFEALEALQEQINIRPELEKTAMDQLQAVLVQHIGVPAFDWQQRIFNFYTNLQKMR